MLRIPFWLISILIILCSASFTEKSKILIIGDSISIGYTPYVRKNLEQLAEVVHNPGNAQHTGTGLEKVEEWIGNESWKIIQFNWGLWDLCYRHPDSEVQGNRDKVNGAITNTPETYAANLEKIVKLMKGKSSAQLVFVTTSFVPEQEAGRFTEDASIYNEIAREIMQKHGILIHDIYESSKSIHAKFGKGSGDVHYTDQGYLELGIIISDFLKELL